MSVKNQVKKDWELAMDKARKLAAANDDIKPIKAELSLQKEDEDGYFWEIKTVKMIQGQEKFLMRDFLIKNQLEKCLKRDSTHLIILTYFDAKIGTWLAYGKTIWLKEK